MSATAVQTRTRLVGEIAAREVVVGDHMLYGSHDVGRVFLIEPMQATYGPGLGGQPVLKFTIQCSGGRWYYFARFPHEPVNVVQT